MLKSGPPPPPDRPSRAQIEELRRQADVELERRQGKPLPEKAKLDQATLEALDATKH
jgi:hypothetical protein